MAEPEAAHKNGTLVSALRVLNQKGLTYSSVIDIGCADGSFFVYLLAMGLLPNCIPINIDANSLYEPTLREIKDAVGGTYLIAAMSDTPGEMTLTKGAHPYWSSLRPSDDPYWDRVNKMSTGTETVPVYRLDDVIARMKAPPPYLLKLDIQGSETKALRGARQVLEQTQVVVCEADIDDYREIDTELAAAGFDLYDLTDFHYIKDQSLGWFYPVYLNRKLAHMRERQIWDESVNQANIQLQDERRQRILTWYADVLPKIKAARQGQTKPHSASGAALEGPAPGRGDPPVMNFPD